MDTSETYVKMCGKVEEIQALKKYRNGDYFANFVSGEWQPPYVYSYGIMIPYCFGDYDVWLPRQDQLLEIVDPDNFLGCYILLKNLRDFAQQSVINDMETPSEIQPQSMEQLWLAFVMKEKYNKVWDGTDWIK